MTTLTVELPDAAVKVAGAVHVSGVGAPAPAVHGPELVCWTQVDATWPKRRVMDPKRGNQSDQVSKP